LQAHARRDEHEVRQHVQIISAPADREVVEAAQRRLLADPGDADALFAVAAWDEVVGDRVNAMELLNRLVSRQPDYPGVWWLRARVLKDLGREGDANACEVIARLYAEPDFPECIRKFRL
jgi:tetratricopeptide (TPR) repeat protein